MTAGVYVSVHPNGTRPRVDEHHSASGSPFVVLAYGPTDIHLATVADAEQLAQAALDAANLLRDSDDPPAVMLRTEPLAGPVDVDVDARLAPYAGAYSAGAS